MNAVLEEEIETTEIPLQDHQLAAIEAEEPGVVLCTGGGAGKSFTGARWIISRAVEFPESIHLAAANNYPQAADTIIPELTRACDTLDLDYRWKGSDKAPTLWLDVGDREAEIRVRSMEKFERRRGPEYGSLWWDEVRDAKPEAWEVIIGRLRCTKVDRPRYLLTTTPRGHDPIIYKLHRKNAVLARSFNVIGKGGRTFEVKCWKHPNGKRLMIQCDSLANAFVWEGYEEALEENLSKKMLAQEKKGDCVATGDVVYETFKHEEFPLGNISREAVYVPGIPVEVNLDFNVGFMACTLTQERIFHGRMRTVQFGEIVMRESRTKYVIQEYQKRLPGIPPIIFGDANGHKRDTRSGTSDYNQWTQAIPGTQLRVPKANGDVSDGVESVNCRMETSAGHRDYVIHPDCEATIDDLENVVWKKGADREIDKRDENHTHLTDTIRYNVVQKHPVRRLLDTARLAAGDKNLWRTPS